METGRHAKFYFVMAICAVVFTLSGCATTTTLPPALDSETTSIDVSKESIALLTLEIANDYKPSFRPFVNYVYVRGEEEKEQKEYAFKVDATHKEYGDSFSKYLISFQLPPGKYKIEKMLAFSDTFPIVGRYTVPLNSSFSMEPHKIIYLGHIEARIKERTDDHLLRAGPVIPLIDQAASGASGGTFVVTINDSFEDDIKLFQEKFPYLAQYQVDDNTLPQWTQPTEKDMQ